MTTVRISVTQLPAGLLGKPARRAGPQRLVKHVIDDDATAAEHAIAWATARGYHQLVGAFARMFSEPPKSGFAAIINGSALLVFRKLALVPDHIVRSDQRRVAGQPYATVRRRRDGIRDAVAAGVRRRSAGERRRVRR